MTWPAARRGGAVRRRSLGGQLASATLRGSVLAIAGLVAVACALTEPPPGTHPDTRPPEVETIVPGRDTVAPGFDGDARIRFDEPIRVGAQLQRDLIASPADRYRVSTGFSDIRIRPERGWREGVVYCFEIPAGITDLLGNRTDAPLDFCFSTGPPVTATEVTGRLSDRVTGQPIAEGGRVLFYPVEGDTVPYTAVPRRDGEFRLRSLPPGEYRAYGFVDRNRNLRLDRALEPYDSATFVLDGPEDRATLAFRAMEPDTTPPVLRRVLAVDSLTLRLEFDDHLPREQPDARVTVIQEETERRWSVRAARVGQPESDAREEPEPPPAEEDEPPLEEPLPPPDEPREAPPDALEGLPPGEAEVPPARRGVDPRQEELPDRVVTVRLAEPLVRGSYRVEADGFRNLRQLVGGGEMTFEYPPPETQR